MYHKYGKGVRMSPEQILKSHQQVQIMPEHKRRTIDSRWFLTGGHVSEAIDMPYDDDYGWYDRSERHNHNVVRIREAKIKKAVYNGVSVLIFLLIAYGLTAILLAFRGVRWQYFLAAVVTVPVVSTLLSLAMLLLESRDRDEAALHTMPFIFAIIAALVIRGLRIKVRSKLAGTAVVLLTLTLTAIPLLTVGYLDAGFDVFDRDRYKPQFDELRKQRDAGTITKEAYHIEYRKVDKLRDQLQDDIQQLYWWLFCTSIALYLFLWVPLLQHTYNRLNSYPQKR